MATLTDIGTLIAQTPGICGGRPRIAGTGVSIRRIAGWYKFGLTPEEIAAEIPHLRLSPTSTRRWPITTRIAMKWTRRWRRKRRRLTGWSVSIASPGRKHDPPAVLR